MLFFCLVYNLDDNCFEFKRKLDYDNVRELNLSLKQFINKNIIDQNENRHIYNNVFEVLLAIIMKIASVVWMDITRISPLKVTDS
jgi:hypothetical protein